MKKLTTLAMICFIVSSMQAKIVYVTPDATATTLPTTPAWSSPVTLTTAIKSAGIADSIFIKAGTYNTIPFCPGTWAATMNTTMITLNSTRLIYGGFAGTEANTAQRVKSDMDGNGMVEAWEYTNQTIFDGNNQLAVLNCTGGNSVIDGIVVQNGYAELYHNTTSANKTFCTKDASSVICTFATPGVTLSTAMTLKNCIIRNCKATTEFYDGPTTGASDGVPNNPGNAVGLSIKNVSAVVNGCLIESNIFDFKASATFLANTAVNALATAPTFSNTTGVGVYHGGGIIKNSHIRNNIAKGYKYTLTNAKTGEIAIRGAGMYVNNKDAYIFNCIFSNNEIQATDLVGNDAIAGGGFFADNAGSFFNCTVVNNKVSSYNTTTASYNNGGYGGGAYLKTASAWTAASNGPIVKVYNSVFWNNSAGGALDPNRANLALRNNFASCMLEVHNNVLPTASYWYGNATSITTQTSNNAYANYQNCVLDLSATNSGTNAPLFASPSSVVGHSTNVADIKANWSVLSGSYLAAKATTPFIGTDFAGNTYSFPTASVGAFELAPTGTKITPVITWAQAFGAPIYNPTTPVTIALAGASSNVSDGAPITYIASNNVVSIDGTTATVNRGGYTSITAYQAATDKYNAAAVCIPFTVSACSIVPVLAWTQDLSSVLTTTATITATATSSSDSYLLATNPVSYSSSNTAVVTVSGNVLNIKGVGTATITAAQNQNASFPAATSITNTITVAAGTPVLTWTQDLSAVKTTDNQVLLNATSSVTDGAAIVYTSADTTIVKMSGSNLLIQAKPGTTTVTAEQPANAKYNATLPVMLQVTVIDANGVKQTFDFSPVTVKKNSIVSNMDGYLQVSSFNGQIVKNMRVSQGQEIMLPSGAFIVKATTENNVYLRKIVL